MGSKPSTPQAPDPAKTAAAQGVANKETAIAQAQLNMIDAVGPNGTITYKQLPTTGPTYNDAGYQAALESYNKALKDYNSSLNNPAAGGGSRAGVAPVAPKYEDFKNPSSDVPRYQQITELSPEQQKQFDLQNQIAESSLGLGKRQIGAIDSALSSPFQIQGGPVLPENYSRDRQNIEDKLFQGYTRRFDDQFGRSEEQLRTRLANQGINEGSEAFSNALKDYNYGKNDAYQGAAATATQQAGAEQSRLFGLDLTGRQQGIQEQVLERTQPINELAALLGNSGGVNLPSFAATPPQTGIQGTDVTGPTIANYQAQMNAANQAAANQQSMWGNLFGLGGSLGAAAIMSDRRTKENIEKVGKLDNGLPVYLYNYKGGTTPQIGVMAQDVEKENPDAVIDVSGIKMVKYDEAVQ